MLATIRSAAVIGIDAYDVSVEVDCAQGLPMFTVVGLPAGGGEGEPRARVGRDRERGIQAAGAADDREPRAG